MRIDEKGCGNLGCLVANLAGPNGTHMRCRMDLMNPASGMAGGGQGQRQLPSGDSIDTKFTAGRVGRSHRELIVRGGI